jgi:hypothetical protein
MGKNTYKSIGAVVAGLITGAVLSIGTDFALGALGIFPPIGTGTFLPWMLVLAFIYRSIYAAAGGFVTAMLAPNQPMRHVVILGIIGIMVSAVGVVVGWRLSDHWYPIALVVIALPCTWLGGKLKTHNR